MPTIALASHYWPGDGEATEPAQTADVVPRPLMADGTIVGMFAFSLPRGGRKLLRRWFHKLKQLIPLRLISWWMVSRLIFSSTFSDAVEAAQAVASDPASRNIKTWPVIHRIAVSNPNEGENAYRHLSALLRMDPKVSRRDRSVLVDVAWLGINGRH